MASDLQTQALAAYRRFVLGEVAVDLDDDAVVPESDESGDVQGRELLSATSLTAFGLVALLNSPEHPQPFGERLRVFEKILAAVRERRPLPVGSVLGSFLRGLRRIRLVTLESPWLGARGVAERRFEERWLDDPSGRSEWLDFALEMPHAPVQFIPLSVFTRRFFLEELPAIAESPPAVDRFHYHAENDKSLVLRERFADLRAPPRGFQYFIDASGLTEIVIDSEALGVRECFFAANLFGRYNGIAEVTLDGLPVLSSDAR